jgi:hypothetical protein
MRALPRMVSSRRAKETLRRKRKALGKARDMVQRQAEELELLKALLCRRVRHRGVARALQARGATMRNTGIVVRATHEMRDMVLSASAEVPPGGKPGDLAEFADGHAGCQKRRKGIGLLGVACLIARSSRVSASKMAEDKCQSKAAG